MSTSQMSKLTVNSARRLLTLDLVCKFFKVKSTRSMETFIQTLNPISGTCEWKPSSDDYDYHQEVARSAFADMLHDSERNRKYYAAIQKSIERLHRKGIKANVLDIGAGTGLLSMMAVKSGADSVTSCEAFLPMANCAEQVIEANGMRDKIKLIKKRSTELRVGLDGDLANRANVLVTEVFDTELIGEGAIEIFNHAHRELLTNDCIVIPSRATIYSQVVESSMVSGWNKPKVLVNLDAEVLLRVPKAIQMCEGECAVQDLQLSQVPETQFSCLSDPLEIFDFNFLDPKGIPKTRRNPTAFTAKSTGVAHGVFFWWDIKLDVDDEIILSCAPYWAHPDFARLKASCRDDIPIQNVIPWRDHWTQAVYHLPTQTTLTAGSENTLIAYHDDYSFWFDVRPSAKKDAVIPRLRCTCGLHLAYSRTRVGQINHIPRTKKYMSYLEDTITTNSVVLSISDGSLLGLATRALGAKKVICFEPNRLSRGVLQSYIDENNLTNATIVQSLDVINGADEITHVVGEPYFITSVLPWDNFYFGTIVKKLRSKLAENVHIIPGKATVYAAAVEFLDLFKIRAPLDVCEGFKHSVFDSFIEHSSKLADAAVEAQPLWEYPCKALSYKQPLMTIDFGTFDTSVDNSGVFKIQDSGTVNGIAIWVDWSLDGSEKDKRIVTTGPLTPIEIGKYIKWDMYTRQGVHLLHAPKSMNNGEEISWNVQFSPDAGDISFKLL